MSNIWFCSDLHLGHSNIHRFRKGFGDSSEEHDQLVLAGIAKELKKKDTLYVLGDAAFTSAGLLSLKRVVCNKILIKGNHDLEPFKGYSEVFSEVYGLLKYKGFWLSHAPIHEQELRNKVNLHGHTHSYNILKEVGKPEEDPRYFNCCVENLQKLYGRPLVSLDEIRDQIKEE